MSLMSLLSVEQIQKRIKAGEDLQKTLIGRRDAHLEKLGFDISTILPADPEKNKKVEQQQDVALVQPETTVRARKLRGALKLWESAVFSLFSRQRTENLLLHTVARFTAFPALLGFMLLQTMAAGINLRREAQKENTEERQLKWATFSFVSSAVTTVLAIAAVALIFGGLYLVVAPILMVVAFAVGTITSFVYALKDTWSWWSSRRDLIKRHGDDGYKALKQEYQEHMAHYKEQLVALKKFKSDTFKAWHAEHPKARRQRFWESDKRYATYLKGKLREPLSDETNFEYRVYLAETVGDFKANEYLQEFDRQQMELRESYFNFKPKKGATYTADDLKQFAECQYYARKAARGWMNVCLGAIGTVGAATLLVVAPGVANVAAAVLSAGTGAVGVGLVVDEHRDPGFKEVQLNQKESLEEEIKQTGERLVTLRVALLDAQARENAATAAASEPAAAASEPAAAAASEPAAAAASEPAAAAASEPAAAASEPKPAAAAVFEPAAAASEPKPAAAAAFEPAAAASEPKPAAANQSDVTVKASTAPEPVAAPAPAAAASAPAAANQSTLEDEETVARNIFTLFNGNDNGDRFGTNADIPTAVTVTK